MANPIYTIQEKPQYQREIPAITTQTPAHAETVLRPLFESVINNTEYVRQRAEEVAGALDEVIEGLTPEDIGAIPISEKAAAGGVATLGSDGKVPVGQLPAMNYDAAGSAAAVKNSLDTHMAAANPHSGSVPTSRKVNGKALTGDVTLTAGDLGAATVLNFNATLPTTGWAGSGPYTLTLPIPGLPECNPLIGPILDNNPEIGTEQQEAWNTIYKVDVNDGRLVITCSDERPTVAVPFQIQAVKAGS